MIKDVLQILFWWILKLVAVGAIGLGFGFMLYSKVEKIFQYIS